MLFCTFGFLSAMSPESEKITRKLRINKLLTASGWLLRSYDPGIDTSGLTNCAVEEYPTAYGPADYALFVYGKLLGIVEAKRLDIGAANVLEQAKRYSRGADQTIGDWNGYRVPFLYSSNGEIIFHLDVRSNKELSRQLYCFHSPDALDIKFQSLKGTAIRWLSDHPIDTPGLRPYQRQAIESYERNLQEAKRWQHGNVVGRPDIQKFVGALAGQGAKKGIFITTSSFTKEALDYQPKNETKIVRIRREQLAQYMIDYDLGVTTVSRYDIKRIDHDYFGDE